MARRYGRKITCAYAEPTPKPKKIRQPRPTLSDAEKALKKAETAARAETRKKVKAWEEEILACEHTLTLEQLATGPIPASGVSGIQIYGVLLV